MKVIGHPSVIPEEVSKGTANFKRECVSEEGSINYIEEDKIDRSLDGNSH